MSLRDISIELRALNKLMVNIAGHSEAWDRQNLNIQDLSSKVRQQEKDLDELERRLNNISGSSSPSTNLSDIARSVSNFESKLSDLSRSISDAKSDLSSAKSDLSSLKSDVSTLKSAMR